MSGATVIPDGEDCQALAALVRQWNLSHDGVLEIRQFLLDPQAIHASVVRKAITRLGHFLICRVDIDPVFKHDFRLLIAAMVLYQSIYPADVDRPLEWIYEHGIETYRRVRELAFTLYHAFEDVDACHLITDYDRFRGLERIQRLRLQATLIRRNAADMASAREVLLDACCENAGRLLNVGDGVRLNNSFLGALVPRAEQRAVRHDIVSIDWAEGIFTLEREAASRLTDTASTFAFERIDACDTWFADATFDCAVGSFMWDECQDRLGLLRELGRVVREGGTVCLSSHHLSADMPTDDFVHNFSDTHTLSGWPATLEEVVRLGTTLGWKVRRRLDVPHAWAVVFTVEAIRLAGDGVLGLDAQPTEVSKARSSADGVRGCT